MVATCQFPVSGDIARNARYVRSQMRTARARSAVVAHFPEGALSGYAGVDFPSFAGFDWRGLRRAMQSVMGLARRLGLWVVLGSAHPLSGGNKPHNSLYVIDAGGELVERYDKRFCSGDASGRTGDLAHYAPGDHASVFTIDGVRCGGLICYDYRFPELYRDYVGRGVQLVFHSYHAARMDSVEQVGIGEDVRHLNRAGTYPGITMPAVMTAEAAANHVWISCPNSSARESCWGSFVVRADGVTCGRLPRNRAGVLVSTVDTGAELYDSTAIWRHRAMSGVLHSGALVDDPRSLRRSEL